MRCHVLSVVSTLVAIKYSGSLTIFAKEAANIDSLLSKYLAINEKDGGQSILSSRNAKMVKELIFFNIVNELATH